MQRVVLEAQSSGAGNHQQLCGRDQQHDIVGEVLPEFDDFNYWALGNGTYDSTHAPINYIPEPNDPWGGWPNQHGFRSHHPAGANFAWGDAHVSFIDEAIDRDIYRGVSTRAMSEVVRIQ